MHGLIKLIAMVKASNSVNFCLGGLWKRMSCY